ncbi:MFS transporter, NNP family, nitrate/nitrite transporter [Capnocytophaga haemolytica]|jgi:putative nitrate/nitrite transporter|uniref:MFS transporter n=1 Tax=Capnocytophaga haemolytica TaxID=45243 RepID=A0AAX2GWW8_9FLAO|nr:MFS transporter [Capnocytophaga haemolytica]AMD84741.1 MFS transporter [Capnocytophaga haemolytica]SFN72910.1 MFS transporter, NNP family, nitrate/nitrite transporter [Capnocytophaga haemolytica]SNV07921.1 Probable nitrate/nitrite transporter narK2 [Capnocytophaga haemolytica]
MDTSTSLKQSHKVLFFNTLAFTICFACWTLNGVLVTYLVDKEIFNWSVVETGWLLGIPILSGSIMRVPMGILTDKYGGKIIFSSLLIFCSIPLFLLHFVNSYWMYFTLSILFGMIGTGFAIGIAFTSVWYPKNWQGRALGIFGMGNAGAALTTFFAPTLLNYLCKDNPDGWRWLPVIYGVVLLVMALCFLLFTKNKTAPVHGKTTRELLAPLAKTRVWRFGLYYFLVFGLFVAFSQWLLPYYVNVYQTSIVLGGILTSAFSLPSGVIRAVGGWLSDKFGARAVMQWVLYSSLILGGLLMLPKMEILTPGKGVVAKKNDVVKEVTDTQIVLGKETIAIKQKPQIPEKTSILPESFSWQEALVKQNQEVKKKELLAEGKTLIKFEADMWVFAILVILIGTAWGIGKAAVYKYIPEYYPNEVGLVGGMVGLIGGLGGFLGPILFGYLLDFSGLWTSSWIFVFVMSAVCIWWMNSTIRKMNKKAAPEIADKIEE